MDVKLQKNLESESESHSSSEGLIQLQSANLIKETVEFKEDTPNGNPNLEKESLSAFTNKSFETYYIDELFQTSSENTESLPTASSSETNRRQMEEEIQAVLEKERSQSLSSESSISASELVPNDRMELSGLELSAENGSDNSLGFEKEEPILFVELSKKMDTERSSSETSSPSSISIKTSSQVIFKSLINFI